MITNHVHYGFSKVVAKRYGVNGALILNRIVWSISHHWENEHRYANRYYIDGHWWMEDSYQAIARHFDGLISEQTIRRSIIDFEEDGILLSRVPDPDNGYPTKCYAINLEMYEQLHSKGGVQNEPRGVSKMNPRGVSKMNPGGVQNEQSSTNILTKSLSHNHLTPPKPSAPGVQSPAPTQPPQNEQGTTALALKSQTKASTPPKAARQPKGLKTRFDAEDLVVAEKWLAFAVREMPWSKPHASWTPEQFATDLARIRRATGLNHDGLHALMRFIENDPFWCKNALSPAGLLGKSGNGLRKVDNILVRMRPDADRQRSKIASFKEDLPDMRGMSDDEVANTIF